MKALTKKVLETLFREEFERSKHWPEKTSLLVESADDLGLDELAHELLKESFRWNAR